MYPEGADTAVTPGALGTELEGAVRPGHFAGVLTVVSKLFHIVGPDVAFFGEKDYQQLVLIKKMVRDLDFPLSIVGVPIVREPDGLALSSRNVYLSAPERRQALAALPGAAGRGGGGRARRRRGAGRRTRRARRGAGGGRRLPGAARSRPRPRAAGRATPGCWWRRASAPPG